MPTRDSSTSSEAIRTVGFYSVLNLESIGYCGGLLVLDPHGKPLEFHCTLPILPEPAQRILYGTALEPYLFSEHIGPPLLAKARNQPQLVLVKDAAALPLGHHVAMPVVRILGDESSDPEFETCGSQSAHESGRQIREITQQMDLHEPFERIRIALDEAHTVTRQDG